MSVEKITDKSDLISIQPEIRPTIKQILSENSVQEVKHIFKKNKQQYPIWLDSINHTESLINESNLAISSLEELKQSLAQFRNYKGSQDTKPIHSSKNVSLFNSSSSQAALNDSPIRKELLYSQVLGSKSVEIDLNPSKEQLLMASSEIKILTDTTEQFSSLFVSPFANPLNSSGYIEIKPSLVLKTLASFKINSASHKSSTYDGIISESTGDHNPSRTTNSITRSSASDLIKDRRKSVDILGWASRRRSSLVGGQLIFARKDSIYDSGYQLANFLPNFILNFIPDLSHLHLPQYQSHLNFLGRIDNNSNHAAEPQKDGYFYIPSNEISDIQKNLNISTSVSKKLCVWFSGLENVMESLIISVFKDILSTPKDLFSALIILIRSGNFNIISPSDDVSYLFFNRGSSFVDACNDIQLGLISPSTHPNQKFNTPDYFPNMTFSLIVPIIDRFFYNEKKSKITESFDTNIKKVIESWSDSVNTEGLIEAPEINSSVWGTRLSEVNVLQKSHHTFLENFNQSYDGNEQNPRKLIIRSRDRLENCLDPYPNSIIEIMNLIKSITLETLNEAEEWIQTLRTLDYNLSKNSHGLSSLVYGIGDFTFDTLLNTTKYLQNTRILYNSKVIIKHEKENNNIDRKQSNLELRKLSTNRKTSMEYKNLLFLLGYLSISLASFVKSDNFLKLVDLSSANDASILNNGIDSNKIEAEEHKKDNQESTVIIKLPEIKSKLIELSIESFSPTAENSSNAFVTKFNDFFSQILQIQDFLVIKTYQLNPSIDQEEHQAPGDLPPTNFERAQLREAANDYMSGLINNGKTIRANQEEGKNIFVNRRTSIRSKHRSDSNKGSKNLLRIKPMFNANNHNLFGVEFPSQLISEISLDLFFSTQSKFFGDTIKESGILDKLINLTILKIEEGLSEIFNGFIEKITNSNTELISRSYLLQLFIDISYLSLFLSKMKPINLKNCNTSQAGHIYHKTEGSIESGDDISSKNEMTRIPFQCTLESLLKLTNNGLPELKEPFNKIFSQISKSIDNVHTENYYTDTDTDNLDEIHGLQTSINSLAEIGYLDFEKILKPSLGFV
ncbi:hypothetical protein AYI68_g7103 [Smittium mucronatum]|uniref:Uncharacterized protein n=1 Tax=Smittium mucronatum TaxID=133383 RepID=A0A1R0GPM9_9FUNG|nr:hypothetical protein AYI68_g7103 [Smittium mucronatum]